MTYTWNATLEAEPLPGDSPRYGDDKIRRNSIAIRERLAPEHLIYTSGAYDTQADHGLHRQGSAVAFCQAGEPTTRPDGTALGNDSKSIGRIWVDTDDNKVYYWNGTAWTLAKASPSSAGSGVADSVSSHTLDNEAYIILDDDGYNLIVCGGTLAADRTVTLPTLADNLDRVLQFVNLSPSGSYEWIIDGEGAETINGTTSWRMKTYGECFSLVGTATTWAVLPGSHGTYRNANVAASGQSTVSPAVKSTWYNVGSISLVLEPGVWDVYYHISMRVSSNTTTGQILYQGTVHTTNNSYTARHTAMSAATDVSTPQLYQSVSKSFRLVVAASATYYLNVMCSVGGAVSLDSAIEYASYDIIYEAKRVA